MELGCDGKRKQDEAGASITATSCDTLQSIRIPSVASQDIIKNRNTPVVQYSSNNFK